MRHPTPDMGADLGKNIGGLKSPLPILTGVQGITLGKIFEITYVRR
jgi:hypothetical protein